MNFILKRITLNKLLRATTTILFISATIITTAQTQKGADIDGEALVDQSGWSVSMPNPNTLAIGARWNDGNGTLSGHVRVYEWNGGTWVQKGNDIDGEAIDDWSGSSVSMPDINTVAIGAPYNDGNGSQAGHVRIYKWTGISWVQKGNDIDGEATGDALGWSVSMPDSNTIAIGAPRNSGNGFYAGHVRVYTWTGVSWIQKGNDIDGEVAGDLFGISISMPDINTVAVGAPSNDGTGSDAGHVRVYTWNGNTWVQKGMDIDGKAIGDWSGTSVCMPDANTIAFGAPNNDDLDSNAGQVRVFTWLGSSWVQKGNDINGEAVGNKSGSSVCMPDINTVAIGAPYNRDNGMTSGHVRVYIWDSSVLSWVQKGSDMDGEAARDNSGLSISMPDTNTIAIGARFNDGSGDAAGHVRVYEFTPSTGIKKIKSNILFSIYPNPTSETLTIDCKEYINQIEVIDIVGKVVLQETSNKKQINTQNLPNGKYILKIYTDKGIAIQSFIKE